MGLLWDIIQRHIDNSPYPPSIRTIATKLGVSPQAVANWRTPKALPSRENIAAIAQLTGRTYDEVLAAALLDTGYVNNRPPDFDAQRNKVIATLKEMGANEVFIESVRNTGPMGHNPTRDAYQAASRALNQKSERIRLLLEYCEAIGSQNEVPVADVRMILTASGEELTQYADQLDRDIPRPFAGSEPDLDAT